MRGLPRTPQGAYRLYPRQVPYQAPQGYAQPRVRGKVADPQQVIHDHSLAGDAE